MIGEIAENDLGGFLSLYMQLHDKLFLIKMIELYQYEIIFLMTKTII